MEQHPDLARGFVKGDRVHFEKLWVDLTSDLNASGPPTKEVSAWKKVSVQSMWLGNVCCSQLFLLVGMDRLEAKRKTAFGSQQS